MAHLVGFPIQGYEANAVKNSVSFYPLADNDRGADFARRLGFDSPRKTTSDNTALLGDDERESGGQYFSKSGRGAATLDELSVFRGNATNLQNLPSEDDPLQAWPFRGFDDRTIDQLTVISVAGVCAEILAFGNSEGGIADFNQLKQIFRGAAVEISEREADNRIRFALGYTMSQLRLHLPVVDALADAMETDASVADCVVAIETSRDISGGTEYEQERRKRFSSESLFERTLLGGRSNAELWDTNNADAKPPLIELTGDDPVYLAVGVALVFFLWASSGGLSLH